SVLYERYIEMDRRIKDMELNIVHIAEAVKSMSQVVSIKENKNIENEIKDDSAPKKKVVVPTMGQGKDMTYMDKTEEERGE
ncbi:hypothetical protein LCGC14_2356340, partial [marine sediment metagenome]